MVPVKNRAEYLKGNDSIRDTPNFFKGTMIMGGKVNYAFQNNAPT